MPELTEVFEMVSSEVEPDVDAWKELERRQHRTAKNRRIAAFAVVACIAVIAIVLIARAVPEARRQVGIPSVTSAPSPSPSFDTRLDLYVLDPRADDPEPYLVGEGDQGQPEASPDGEQLVYLEVFGETASEIWIRDTAGSRELTDIGELGSPTWAPDGRRIAFVDGHHISVIDADGAGRTTMPFENVRDSSRIDWSADGTRIVFVQGDGRIGVVDVASGSVTQLTRPPEGRRTTIQCSRRTMDGCCSSAWTPPPGTSSSSIRTCGSFVPTGAMLTG